MVPDGSPALGPGWSGGLGSRCRRSGRSRRRWKTSSGLRMVARRVAWLVPLASRAGRSDLRTEKLIAAPGLDPSVVPPSP